MPACATRPTQGRCSAGIARYHGRVSSMRAMAARARSPVARSSSRAVTDRARAAVDAACAAALGKRGVTADQCAALFECYRELLGGERPAPGADQCPVFGAAQYRPRIGRGDRVANGMHRVLHDLWLDRSRRSIVAQEVTRQLLAKDPINMLERGEHLKNQRRIRTESAGPSEVHERCVPPALREACHVAAGQSRKLAQDAPDLSQVRVQFELSL